MPARNIVHVRNGENITLVYAKKKPATGTYYDDTEITAVSAEIIKPDGTVLTPTNAPVVTYFSTAGGYKGYRVTWDPATDADGHPWLLVVLTPTRAGGVSIALTMPREYELDFSDLAKRQDEIEAKVDVADAAVDALQTDFNAFEVTNQSEHDATQATLADATYGLAALNTDLDAILTKIGSTADTGGSTTAGTAMAKMNKIQEYLRSGNLSISLGG